MWVLFLHGVQTMTSSTKVVAVLALLSAACASSAEEPKASVAPTTESDFSSFSVPPMYGSPALCAGATTLNLPDAAWASWFADVAYADIPVGAKPIEAAGWGRVGDAEKLNADYGASVLASLVFSPQADALHHALYEAVHPDRGMEFFSVGSSQLVWADHRTAPVSMVALRGTFAFDDAFMDLDAWLVKGPLAGNVHEGFLAALAEVEAVLDQRLALLPESQTVIVTGHSAGAAVGTLWVAHRLEQGDKHHFVVDTFGSPRVGDPTFAAAFTKATADRKIPVTRFHNGDDPVPTQPLEALGYAHVGTPVHLLEDAAELDDAYVFTGILGNVHDHAKALYFERVAQRMLAQSPAYAIRSAGTLAGATVASLSECR